MERQWNGKNVLVSGAENEIGRAVARMFASHGARIAVAAPVREEAEKVVAEISESGGEAIAFSADPADVDQVRRMVRYVTETLGSIDILVNNAGGDNLHAVGIVRAFSESEPAQWAPFLESVLRGTIATIRYVLPQMIVRRTGRIVNLVSVAGVSGLQGAPIRSAVYSTTARAMLIPSKVLVPLPISSYIISERFVAFLSIYATSFISSINVD